MRFASFARDMRRRFISRSICHAKTRFERAGFALCQQTVLLEEGVEIRTDVLALHIITVTVRIGSGPFISG